MMRTLFQSCFVACAVVLTFLLGGYQVFFHRDSPQQAKRRHSWWLRPVYSESEGHAVNLMTTSAFSSAFPGYTQPKDPSQFWNRYFSHKFDADIRLDEFSASEDRVIPTPWLSCPDFFREQGADVIFLGTSEMYRAYHAKTFTERLGSDAKLLNCGRSSLLPTHAKNMADLLGHFQKPKAQAIFIGYNMSWAYPEETGKFWMHDEQLAELQGYVPFPHEGFLRFWYLDGETLFGKASWDRYFPSAVQQKRNAELEKPVPNVSQGTFYQGERERNIFLRREDVDLIGTPKFTPLPYYRMVEGGRPECGDLPTAERQLRELVSAAGNIAERTYLYISPITPLGEENFSPCFRNFVTSLMKNLESERVRIRTDTWEAYGLDWGDFVHPTRNPQIVQTDFNHANYRGALKISRTLADWIMKDWRRREVSE